MTRIVARKAMTVNALRERLTRAMAKPHQRDCTACSGTGKVSGPLSAAEVVAGADIPQSAFYGFTKGKSMSLEAGLKLVAYLDRLEDPLSVLDDEDEGGEDVRDSARAKQLRQASSEAAAKAGIDAMNKPIEFANGGGVAAKPDRRLTLGQVHEVRRAMASGAKAPDLARAYDVGVRTIYRACEGEIQEGEVGGRRVVMQIVEGREPVVIGRPLEVQA